MTPELLLQHFNRISEAPDAIPRLRRFILDLAVRGKLVEQDPHDEPASELLKSIQAEKARLVKEGTIKKDKPLKVIGSDEQPFKKPVSWQFVRLGQALEMINGRAFKPTDWIESGLPIVRIQNLNNAQAPFNFCDPKTIEDRHLIRDDEFLISWSGTPGTSFGAFIWKRGLAALNQHIFRCVQIGEAFWPAFLRLAINSQLDVLIAQAQGGVGLQHVTKGTLESLPLPLPPLAEQQRIVAKVDELMALCDQLEAERNQRESHRDKLVAASLNRISTSTAEEATKAARFHLNHLPRLTTKPEHIKQLRQTILDLAVRGRLVEQDPNDEPAAELLKRIQAEKVRLVKEGKIRKQSPLATITEDNVPFNLPFNWQWIRFGEIIEDADSGWSPKSEGFPRTGDNWGVLKVSAVSWDRFLPEENKQLLSGVVPPPSTEVRQGDFLISRANTSVLVAKSVVVDKPPKMLIMSDKIVRLQLTHECDKRFLCLVNNSAEYARNYYAEQASGTSLSMKNVSRPVIYGLVVPLPPLAEQHRIVAKVDQLMSLCDQLEAQLTTTESDSRRLLEAVLRDALNFEMKEAA